MAENMIDRRKLIQAMGTASAAVIAGCSGEDNGDDSNGDHGSGERVPELTFAYWSDMGGEYTTPFENTLPVIEDSMAELGVDVSHQPMSFSANVDAMVSDAREFEFTYFGHSATATRLDPTEFVQDYAADEAFGSGNWGKYVNCDFTDIAYEQAFVDDREERQQMINEAHQMFSEDGAAYPVMHKIVYGGVNERINLQGLGDFGLHSYNPWWQQLSEVEEGDNRLTYSLPPAALEKMNMVVSTGGTEQESLLHSPLVEYQPDLEIDGVLADDWELDGSQTIVEIHDDAVFHNGDPVTAEDVAWTFNFLYSNRDVYYWYQSWPWAEEPNTDDYGPVEIVDDKTVIFHTERPYQPIVGMVLTDVGIKHRESWIEQGAEDNPEGFEPDPVIGSGPFQLIEHRPGEVLHMEPADIDHPDVNPDHNVSAVAFDDPSAEAQALIAEEIDLVQESAVSFFDQFEDEDHLDGVASGTYGVFPIYPQANVPPFNFHEFRMAFGAALDREQINQIAYRGEAEEELSATMYMPGHPWRPPEEYLTTYTDDPSGDPEAARDMLMDEGWRFEDGNLYYPEDADIAPSWEQGEIPHEDIPCVDEDGSYAG